LYSFEGTGPGPIGAPAAFLVVGVLFGAVVGVLEALVDFLFASDDVAQRDRSCYTSLRRKVLIL
jgi:hypothetical protein